MSTELSNTRSDKMTKNHLPEAESRVRQALSKLKKGDVILHMELFNKESEHYVGLRHEQITQVINQLRKQELVGKTKVKDKKAYRILKKIPAKK